MVARLHSAREDSITQWSNTDLSSLQVELDGDSEEDLEIINGMANN